MQMAPLTFQRAEDNGFSSNAEVAVRVRPPPEHGGVAQRRARIKAQGHSLPAGFERTSIRNIPGNTLEYLAIVGLTSAIFRFQTSDTCRDKFSKNGNGIGTVGWRFKSVLPLDDDNRPTNSKSGWNFESASQGQSPNRQRPVRPRPKSPSRAPVCSKTAPNWRRPSP